MNDSDRLNKIAELYERLAQTGGHGKRTKILAQIEALKGELA